MERDSSRNLVEKREAVSDRASAAHATRIVTAWIATLLLSNLPLVIARDVLGSDIPWILPAWVGLAVLFVAAAYLWANSTGGAA